MHALICWLRLDSKVLRLSLLLAPVLTTASNGFAQVTNWPPTRAVVKLVPDYARPRVYALDASSGANPGNLLALNSTNGSTLSIISVSLNPTDMVMTPAGDALYVINTGSRTISEVSLSTFTVVGEKAITTPNTYSTANPLHLALGRGNIVYYTDGAWAPNIYALDYATGTTTFVYDANAYWYIDYNNVGTQMGVGGLVAKRDGNTLFSWLQYGWGAGYAYSVAFRIDSSSSTLSAHENGLLQGRDPIDAPIMLNAAETVVFNKSYMLAATNVAVTLGSFGDIIYAIPTNGAIAFGSTGIYKSQGGTLLTNLPFASSVQTLSGDQQKLFRYNAGDGTLVVYDMNSVVASPAAVTNPIPANGTAINPPLQQISWTPNTWALSYRVFLGTDSAAVAAATTNSPLYLGTTPAPSFSLGTALTPGTTYYWRVDSVGYFSATQGTVWSFTVSAITLSPQVLYINGLVGLPNVPQSISLSAAAPTPWTLTIPQPWLSASSTNGTTPASVTLSLSSTNLAAGLYTNTLLFTFNGITLPYPVILRLVSLSPSKMATDRNRNYIYLLHPGSGTTNDAFVVFLNTDTGMMEKILPIGTNPTDMTLNAAEDRLYVSNWQYSQTHVVSLATQSELVPLSLGTNVYRIDAGVAGRVVVQGASPNGVIPVNLINTATGAKVASATLSTGYGECDPSGQYYYYGMDNPHDFYKYYVGGGSFVQVANILGNNFVASDIIASPDGSRVFFCGRVYDTNLVELGSGFGEPIYACSTNGVVAFSSQHAFGTPELKTIHNLPVSSSVQAVDWRNQNLWYFNGTTHQPEALSLAVICAPKITQQPAAATTNIVGANVSLSPTVMGLAPLTYQWTMAGTNLPNATNSTLALNGLQLSQQGDYQVMVSNASGALTSSVAHLTVLIPVTLTTQPQATNLLAGQSLSLSVTAAGSDPLTYRWTFENVTINNATNSTLLITNMQAAQEGIYRAVVQNGAGAVTSAVALVRVFPAGPAILAGPTSQTVPASSNVVFAVTAAGTQPLAYQWLYNGGAITGTVASACTISNAQARNMGSYRVIVTNTLGAVTSAVATLTVLPTGPYFVVQPSGTSQPAGTNVTLSTLVGGSEPIGYQWRLNNTNLSGANQTALTLTNVTLGSSGDYALVASNAFDMSSSAIATVIVTAWPPVFVQQPTSVLVWAGSSTNLVSLANGSTPLQYQWYFQGKPLLNQTSRQLSLSAVTPAAAGPYYVTASNAFNVATSLVAQVIVTNQAPALFQGLTNLVVDAGSTVMLSVQATTNGSPTFTWRLNSTQIATSQTLTITNIQPGQSGYYRVTVANSSGSVSSTGRVSVFGPPSWVTAWGDNSGGQTNVPANLDDVVAVAGGDFHTLALRRNGTLLAWGENADGQVSVPTNPLRFVSIASGAAHNLAITEAGGVVAWGRNDLGQSSVPSSATAVLAVTAGDAHSLALLSSGSLVAWGDNTYGQVSGAAGVTAIRAIAAGRNHNLALRTVGTVVGWGFNAYGQATPPSGLTRVAAVAAGYLHSVALMSNSTVVVWGDNSCGQTNAPAGLTNVVAIAAGDFHTLALRADGSVVGWGYDLYGQIDVPPTLANTAAIASGNYHSLTLAPVIPLLRPHLSAGGLVIEWSGPFVLQSAPAVSGPYTDLSGLWRSYTNANLFAPAGFFRLRR